MTKREQTSLLIFWFQEHKTIYKYSDLTFCCVKQIRDEENQDKSFVVIIILLLTTRTTTTTMMEAVHEELTKQQVQIDGCDEATYLFLIKDTHTAHKYKDLA